MNNRRTFFKYVIPSIIAFALSGVYAIVDGYFVGNTIGDAGLSAINIAYPIVALIQAVGTGIGMGGAVYYSINAAEGNHQKAGQFIAASWWLLIAASIIFTLLTFFSAHTVLDLLGGRRTGAYICHTVYQNHCIRNRITAWRNRTDSLYPKLRKLQFCNDCHAWRFHHKYHP